jgi:CheY-like chemotaxis protein
MAAKQILIVDDTREISRLLEAALKVLDSKLHTKVVPSAEEAFLEISRRVYDLLIVDVRLPGISGLEFTQKVRSVRKNIRIIQISGLNDPGLKDNAISMGADVFLPKPLAIGEFLSTVEGLLDVDPFIPPQSMPPVPQSANPAPEPEPSGNWVSAVVAQAPEAPPPPPVKKPEPVSKPAAAPAAPASPAVKPVSPKPEIPMPRPPAARPAAPQPTSVSDLLTSLRQNLNAVLVALVDERGRMVARAGELPDPTVETSVAPALLASVNASAAASRLVSSGDQDPSESAVVVRSPVYDYVVAPVGFQHMVMVVIERSKLGLHMAQVIEELFSTREELQHTLLPAQPEPLPELLPDLFAEPPAGPVLPPEPALPTQPGRIEKPVAEPSRARPPKPVQVFDPADELDALLNQASPGSIKADELDAFWEQLATGKSSGESGNPGTLSYDQASRLGLTPTDEEKK